MTRAVRFLLVLATAWQRPLATSLACLLTFHMLKCVKWWVGSMSTLR